VAAAVDAGGKIIVCSLGLFVGGTSCLLRRIGSFEDLYQPCFIIPILYELKAKKNPNWQKQIAACFRV
jgi:hypothetical protein